METVSYLSTSSGFAFRLVAVSMHTRRLPLQPSFDSGQILSYQIFQMPWSALRRNRRRKMLVHNAFFTNMRFGIPPRPRPRTKMSVSRLIRIGCTFFHCASGHVVPFRFKIEDFIKFRERFTLFYSYQRKICIKRRIAG